MALFYVFARYRFPIVLVLMLLAAGGILEVLDRVKLRRYRSLAAPAAAAALVLVVSHLPLEDTRRLRAVHYLSAAVELSKDPTQAEMANALYRRALDAAPGYPPAQLGLGVLLARSGRQEEAISDHRKALATWLEYGEARYDPVKCWRLPANFQKPRRNLPRRCVSVRTTRTGQIPVWQGAQRPTAYLRSPVDADRVLEVVPSGTAR